MIIKLLVGILAGMIATLAGVLTARELKPVPPLQPSPKFARNIDVPEQNEQEPIFYMQIEVDGHTAYFSCVKHESLLVPQGVLPK